MKKRTYSLSELDSGVEMAVSDVITEKPGADSQKQDVPGGASITVRYREGMRVRYTINIDAEDRRARIRRINNAVREG